MGTTTTGAGTVSHKYHAEAHALSGKLHRPIEQEIEHQAKVALDDLKGGHITADAKRINFAGLLHFEKAHCHVSGSRSLKHNGWVTVATAVVEELNVFEVIQTDRLVAQVSTDHPLENAHVPYVSFLGTQFKNVSVSGFSLKLDVDLGFCGTRPEGGKSYLEDANFLKAVKQQTEKIAKASGLPKHLKTEYDERLAAIDGLIASAANGKSPQGERKIICSLVQSIGDIPIPGVKSFGNLLIIPEFGTVTLGEVVVGEKLYEGSKKPGIYFELATIKMNLGCVGHGTAQGSTGRTNGHTYP